MVHLARIGMIVAGLALVGGGCSKSETTGDTGKSSKPSVTATDKAGLAAEQVLVLKFHHDK